METLVESQLVYFYSYFFVAKKYTFLVKGGLAYMVKRSVIFMTYACGFIATVLGQAVCRMWSGNCLTKMLLMLNVNKEKEE